MSLEDIKKRLERRSNVLTGTERKDILKLIAVAEALDKARHHPLLQGLFRESYEDGSLWGMLKPGIDVLAALEKE